MDTPAGKSNAKRVNRPTTSRGLFAGLMAMFGGLPRGMNLGEGRQRRHSHISAVPPAARERRRQQGKLNKKNRKHGIRTRVRVHG